MVDVEDFQPGDQPVIGRCVDRLHADDEIVELPEYEEEPGYGEE